MERPRPQLQPTRGARHKEGCPLPAQPKPWHLAPQIPQHPPLWQTHPSEATTKTHRHQVTPKPPLPAAPQPVSGPQLCLQSSTQLPVQDPGVVLVLTSHLQQPVARQNPAPTAPRNPPSTLHHLRHEPGVGLHTTHKQDHLLGGIHVQGGFRTQHIKDCITNLPTHIHQGPQAPPIKRTQLPRNIHPHAPTRAQYRRAPNCPPKQQDTTNKCLK